jgi:serine/threonine-protein kinase
VTAPVQLTPGTVVGGDFRIVEPLSAGGMGALYVAEQISTGKKRALKVMHRQLVREGKLRERFVQEARIGSLIESDHVVDVIGAGIEESTGLPWIAMELLDGQDLADLVSEGGELPIEELVHLLRQLCHALGAAHEAGVVHRDVKPENVFLAKARSADVPWSIKVLDFGIAKVAAQAKGTSTAAVGSPAWMAPEQSETHIRITPAADVWALGLMAFWLIARRPYWRSAQDPDATIHALMREVLFDPLEAASKRAAAIGAEPLPAGFDPWFGRCVVREPADRFANAHQAFAAFEQMLLDAGIDVPVPARSTRPSFERISTMPMGSAVPSAEGRPSHVDAPASESPDPPVESAPEPAPVDEPPGPLERAVGDTVTDVDEGDEDERDAAAAYRPSPTTPMAPALLSATAATGVTRPTDELEDEPKLPLTRRWAQLAAISAVALVIGAALVLAFRSVSDELAAGSAEVGGDATLLEPVAPAEPSPVISQAPPATTQASETRHAPAPTRSVAVRRPASRPSARPSSRAKAKPAPTPSDGPFAQPPPEPGPTATDELPELPPPTLSAPAGPSPSAPAAPPAGPAASSQDDFDRAEAVTVVQRRANAARVQCRHLPGPRIVAATVVFQPSGSVYRVALVHRRQRTNSTTSCVKDVLSRAKIKPYRGNKRHRVSVVVPML